MGNRHRQCLCLCPDSCHGRCEGLLSPITHSAMAAALVLPCGRVHDRAPVLGDPGASTLPKVWEKKLTATEAANRIPLLRDCAAAWARSSHVARNCGGGAAAGWQHLRAAIFTFAEARCPLPTWTRSPSNSTLQKRCCRTTVTHKQKGCRPPSGRWGF